MRVIAGLCAVLMIVTLPNAAWTKKKKKEKAPPARVERVCPPEPVLAPDLTVSQPILEAASGFVRFREDVAAVNKTALDIEKAKAKTPKAIAASVKNLDAAIDKMVMNKPSEVSRGFIAFGALNTMSTPSFRAGVKYIECQNTRDWLMSAMHNDITYVGRLPSLSSGIDSALLAARGEGEALIEVGKKYEELSYSMQKTGLKTATEKSPKARVAALKAKEASVTALGVVLTPKVGGTTTSTGTAGAPAAPATDATASAVPTAPSPAELGARLLEQIALALNPPPPPPVDPAIGATAPADATAAAGMPVAGGSATPTVAATASVGATTLPPNTTPLVVRAERRGAIDRITTAATYEILRASPERPDDAFAVLNDPKTTSCMEWARLHMYQCLSAARFKYEHSFCMAQHALKDVGACMANVAE